MIVWLNGTHGAGKTTTSALLQPLILDSRVFDAEKVGETLMDITPGLPATDNFQHWAPWRPLVVETASRVLDFTGGTLVMPMTVLVEEYWREISSGLAQHAIPVRHFVLHADTDALRDRIQSAEVGPSSFRFAHLRAYADAMRTWLDAKLRSSTPRTSRPPEQPSRSLMPSAPEPGRLLIDAPGGSASTPAVLSRRPARLSANEAEVAAVRMRSSTGGSHPRHSPARRAWR